MMTQSCVLCRKLLGKARRGSTSAPSFSATWPVEIERGERGEARGMHLKRVAVVPVEPG